MKALNPWMGCQHWGPKGSVAAEPEGTRGGECDHCYADTLTSGRMGLDVFGGRSKRRRTSARTWKQAVRWNRDSPGTYGRPTRVFCASLADVFEDAPGPNEWRADLWRLVHDTPWVDWLILTKRPENIARMLPDAWADNRWGYWPNVWLGTSIGFNRTAFRSPILTAVPAHVHFISYEPALGPADEVSLDGIEWVIYGGESGPGWRRHDLSWAFDMWARCEHEHVTFFYKQSAGARTETGIDALGRIVREWPASWDRAELKAAA